MSITRGAPSIGLSNVQESTPALPPVVTDVASHLDYLSNQLADMVAVIEGKADKDRIKTQIALSDEALFLSAEDIVLFGNVTIGNIIKEQNGTTTGNVDPSITRIVGDRVQTGTILSNNWSTTDGTSINLDTGEILIGGSDLPKLKFDVAGNLTISGTLTADTIVESKSIDLGGIADAINDLPNGIQAVLDAGVDNIIAGSSADYQLEVNENSVIAKHKDTDPTGLGSGYSGDLRTGLLVNANGIAMGYNDQGNGDWVNAVSIESNGNVAFRGTIEASVIESTVINASTVTIDGVTIGTISTQAASGDSHASDGGNPHGTSLNEVAGKLDDISDLGSAFKHSTADENEGGGRAFNALDNQFDYIRALATDKITISTTNPDSGVVFDEDGVRAYVGGDQKLMLAADGSASQFYGDILTDGRVEATGSTSAFWGQSSILGVPSVTSRIGVAGASTSGEGVVGGSHTYIGVLGLNYPENASATGVGVEGRAQTNGIGIKANNEGSGTCLQLSGSGLIDGSAIFEDDVTFEDQATFEGHVKLDSSTHNFSIGDATLTGNANICIKSGSAGARTSNQISIYADDVSGGKTSLGLVLDEGAESSTSFTQSHRLKVVINADEYWLSLEAV